MSSVNKSTLMIICLVAGTILLCWFLNNTFLESYYTASKENDLKNAFDRINQGAGQAAMEQLSSQGNITLLVVDSASQPIFFAGGNEQTLMRQLWEILLGDRGQTVEILDSSNGHVLGRYHDQQLSMDYLVMWGSLTSGNLLIMHTALESIRESVAISNRFLAYVGIVGVILAAFVSRFIARNMTVLIDTNTSLEDEIRNKTQTEEMRKEFIDNISHELKTPIALIQGYAEGLLDQVNEAPESREFYCEVIIDEAEKMNRMVKGLLNLNYLESGNEDLEIETFDLNELLRGVLDATSILREQKGISLREQKIAPLYVQADEFRTEEVLVNFISNAIHHVAENADREKEIRIWTKMQQSGNLVRTSIFNTGSNISEKELGKIWEKFYKVDKARTREYGGSGIGLSIVKAIMDSFHQKCGVINHQDGVEFWFELAVSGDNDNKSNAGGKSA